jgi:hypothetical protein
MNEHQMIHSLKRKNNDYIRILQVTSLELFSNRITIFSLFWPLILLHHIRNGFLLASSHGTPISAGFQLTTDSFYWDWAGQALLLPLPASRVPGSSGSKQLPASLLGTTIILILFIQKFIPLHIIVAI